jgi:hypothetical protein
LKDEIAVLKREKKHPRFKASGMEEKAGQDEEESETGAKRRAGSEKRSKTELVEIHEERMIAPEAIPAGSRFKGYESYVVQGLIIQAHNRVSGWNAGRHRRERRSWVSFQRLSEGSTWVQGYILYQYYHAHVTRPLVLEQLREWGVDICAGQIERILNEGKERFHQEKALILRVGLEVAEYLTVDDTGARHQGKNGYTTQLGTEHFAWFENTQTKDCINFLSLLQGGTPSYVINAQALQYRQEQKLPKGPWEQLKNSTTRVFEGAEQWQAHLCALNFTTKRPIRMATEGALLGALRQEGLAETLAIISDDAGQFNVLTHGLCWVHAERLIHQLIPLNEPHREDHRRSAPRSGTSMRT